MVPRPLYCASVALSLSCVGNAPADTTKIETTTATPAARDTADRADFSRTIGLPPETPVPYLAANISSGSTSPHLVMSRNKRTSPPTAKPHRLSTAPGNYAYLSLHALSYRHAAYRRLVSTLQPAAAACQHAAKLRQTACQTPCGNPSADRRRCKPPWRAGS